MPFQRGKVERQFGYFFCSHHFRDADIMRQKQQAALEKQQAQGGGNQGKKKTCGYRAKNACFVGTVVVDPEPIATMQFQPSKE